MDGMCFDYDHFLAEETLIIDDFGEICEDVVRIAGANAQYLCKDFDAELRRSESPGPPGNCIATERCFEKEISSLFSEMEYLTEVSPGTDVVLAETNAITIAVNPSEFSCKRTVRCEPPTGAETPVATVQDCTVQASSPTDEPRQPATRTEQTHSVFPPPLEYQRILNNYIQKGRRKLEASSYSKMKASCLTAGGWKPAPTRSTSSFTLETVTSSTQPFGRTGPGSNAPVTAIVSQPPASKLNHNPASISSTRTVDMIKSSLQPTGAQNRPSTGGLPKTARLHHCRDCGSSYGSNELLRKHSCIIAEQYQCHLCLREFKKRKTLDHHMKSHDKVFSTDDDLRK